MVDYSENFININEIFISMADPWDDLEDRTESDSHSSETELQRAQRNYEHARHNGSPDTQVYHEIYKKKIDDAWNEWMSALSK